VATADVNGDGYSDLVVGGGTVYVHLGGPGGVDDGGPATANTVLSLVASSRPPM
jgi:hypothetical protein